ncbi:sgnh hydrolase [Nannochloropsis oceanica]
MATLSTRATGTSIPISATYVSVRRSSLLFLTLGSFAMGTVLANMGTRSWRRIQRYMESRRSNGGRRPVIVCFGDSITQGGHSPEYVGWMGRLEDFYGRKADVLNRGFSGYNTDWLCRMLNDLFLRLFRRRPPALVTIWVGANDATVESSTQHVPLWKFKQNLEKMVRFFRRLGRRDRKVAVLLITPPPLHEADWLASLRSSTPSALPDRSFARTYAYAQAVKEVGQTLRTPVVDMHAALEGGQDEDRGEEGVPPPGEAYRGYLSDGLHLNFKGNKKAFEAIIEGIKNNFPWLDPINLEMQGPAWETLRSAYLDEAEGGVEGGGECAITLYSSKSSIILNSD